MTRESVSRGIYVLIGIIMGLALLPALFGHEWPLFVAPFGFAVAWLATLALEAAIRDPGAAFFNPVPLIAGCVANGIGWVLLIRLILWGRAHHRVLFWSLLAAIALYWGYLLVFRPWLPR